MNKPIPLFPKLLLAGFLAALLVSLISMSKTMQMGAYRTPVPSTAPYYQRDFEAEAQALVAKCYKHNNVDQSKYHTVTLDEFQRISVCVAAHTPKR